MGIGFTSSIYADLLEALLIWVAILSVITLIFFGMTVGIITALKVFGVI